MTISLIILFGSWWIICFLGQTKSFWANKLKSYDIFHFIPNWRFFAPNPILIDYHLEYRLMEKSDTKTNWVDPFYFPPKGVWCFLWYPLKRYRKTLNTSISKIKKINSEFGFDVAVNSNSYLNLLNYLQNLEHPVLAYALQFRIIAKQDNNEEYQDKLIFVSNWHYQF